MHIAEFADRLLFREDQEVGELTEAIFEANGIHVYTGAKVVKVEKKGKNKIYLMRKMASSRRSPLMKYFLQRAKHLTLI